MTHSTNKIIFVTYRDLKVENLHGYQVKEINCNDALVMVRPQVIPGLFNNPDLHVSVLIVDGIRIFCNTDYPLTDTKKAEIESEAIRLLQEHRTRN